MAAKKTTVRLMRHEDKGALVEIDGLSSGEPRAEYLMGKFKQALSAEQSMVISLVAEKKGKVTGFLMGEVIMGEFGLPESVATVDTVGVHPEAQGAGVGKVLMEGFLAHVRKAGVERVRTMVGWNQWGLMGYFRSAGFVPGTSIVLEREV
jgi:ribosomal protein S18 acetylase RimI-like enzyme